MNDSSLPATADSGARRAADADPDRDGYELRHYLSVVRRRPLAIAIPTLLGLALGILIGGMTPATYTSTAEVIAQVTSPASVLAVGGEGAGASETATEVAVMGSEAVRTEVRNRVGHDVEVTIETDPDSRVSRLTVEGENPEQVQQDAQAYAETYVQLRQGQLAALMTAGTTQVQNDIAAIDTQINDLATPIAEFDAEIGVTYDSVIRNGLENQRQQLITQRDSLNSRRTTLVERLDLLRLAQTVNPTFGVQVLGPASEPEKLGGPGRVGFAVAGAGLGFLLGLVIAFVREHFDDRLVSKQSFEAASGVPVIGMLPRVRGMERGVGVVAELPGSPTAVEAFRRLRTSVQLALGESGTGEMLIASADARDGRTMTAANLAVTLAAADCSVVLIDGNLRRPWLYEVFSISNDIGLSSVLSGSASLSDAVQSLYPTLAVLTAGPPVADPASLLSGSAMQEVLNTLAREVDYLIIDGPPLLPVSDGVLLAQMVDGVVLVARSGRTKTSHINAAMDLLRDARAPMLGAVLNGVSSRSVAAPYEDSRPKIGAAKVAIPRVSLNGINGGKAKTPPELERTTAESSSRPEK
jgi:tyrosine-protein kinase